MIENVTIEEMMKKTQSRFGLVLAAAARANELANGDPALIQPKSKKSTSIALEEMAKGKINFSL